MLPKTYLLSAPMGADSPFGEPIQTQRLLDGLRKVNPLIQWPLPDACGFYPGKEFDMITIWLGTPFLPESTKITAFHLKMPDGVAIVPEFSLVDSSVIREGEETDPVEVIRKWRKGWRAIFEACIRVNAATRRALELEFDVILSNYGAENPACDRCEKMGVKRPATSMFSGLCDYHDGLRKIALGTERTSKEEIDVGSYDHG